MNLHNISPWLKLAIFGGNMLLEDDKLIKDYFMVWQNIVQDAAANDASTCRMQLILNLIIFLCYAFYIHVDIVWQ